MGGRLPVTDIILTSDVEVMTIAVGQGRAGSRLDTFFDILGLVRNGGVVGVPENGVTVKAAEVVSSVGPGDIDSVITRPHAYGVAGTVNAGRVSRCGGINIEWAEVDGGLPVTGVIDA